MSAAGTPPLVAHFEACTLATTSHPSYLRVLCDYVANEEVRPAGSWPERVARLLSRYGDRELPLRHYTKDRLTSPEARFGWVEPDLLPLGPEAVSR